MTIGFPNYRLTNKPRIERKNDANIKDVVMLVHNDDRFVNY